MICGIPCGDAGISLSSSSSKLGDIVGLGGNDVGVLLVWTSTQGRQLAVFIRESIFEARKVVWPTRKETLQTTAMVFVFVLVMAIFLWLTDKTLEWVMIDLILGWKK